MFQKKLNGKKKMKLQKKEKVKQNPTWVEK